MFDFISYMYYRIKKINPDDGNAIIAIQLSIIPVLYLMSISMILDQVFDFNLIGSVNYLMEDDNVITRRLIKLPILLFPIWCFLYFFLRRHNEKIQENCKVFEGMSQTQKRRKNVYLILFVLCTFVFFILGITSPQWVPN